MTTSTSSLELQGKALLLLLMASIMPACAGQPRSLELQGAYRGDSGELVSIRSSQGKTLRARFFESGTSRRLHPTGELTFTAGTEFSNAEPVEAVVEFQGDSDRKIRGLLWTPRDSPPFLARRINLSERVTFDSDGSALSGRLDLPDPGQFTNPIAAVALVHGSGSDAATEYFYSGDFLAAHGIATLTYDKRGTGSSQGEYTFDFGQLADDAAAAIGFLSSHPGLDGVPLGLVGYSQGGWVAPLVASKDSRIEFVVVSYGLIASPAEEARVETRQLLASRGVADHHLDDLDRLTNASVEVVASGFEHGWEELPYWLKGFGDLGRFLRFPRWLIRLVGPRLSPKSLDWHYDSMSVLEALEIPSVWLLAEEDTSAPIELALPMLERLQTQGKKIEVQVFPGADHTMLTLPDGYAPGYFAAEVEAVRRLAEQVRLFGD